MTSPSSSDHSPPESPLPRRPRWARGLSAPGWRGPPTDHFDGRRFRNDIPVNHGRLRDVARWLATRAPGPWDPFADAPPGPPPPRRVDDMRVTWVGHATALVQTAGLNILTDPVWSRRCSPFTWAGPSRVRPPGVSFDDLPPIDVVLLSHNHYDHLDEATLQRLQRAHAPLVVTGLGNAALLRSIGVGNVLELDWWDEVELQSGVQAMCVPAQHFSGRGVADRDATLWAGFVVRGPRGAVYFAGDTGMGPHFARIRERVGRPRLALLPIGAFRPEWFMSRVHTSPDDALDAHRILGATLSMAIHFGTFQLADDGQHEAPERLRALLAGTREEATFWVPQHGEGRDVPPQ